MNPAIKIDRRLALKIGTAVTASLVLQSAVPNVLSAGSETDEERRIRQHLERPTPYNAHVFKYSTVIGDINLERIHLTAAVFCPKEEDVNYPEFATVIQAMLGRISTFWEKTLDGKVKVVPELIPHVFQGSKTADQYQPYEIHDELEAGFREKIADPILQAKCLSVMANKRNRYYPSSGGEFFTLGILGIQGKNLYNSYQSLAFGDVGFFQMVGTTDYFTYSTDLRSENVFAHEMGHSFGLPDQYPFDASTPGRLPPNKWYDPDPLNIMGAEIHSHDLASMHLANSTKKWMINKMILRYKTFLAAIIR